MAQPVDGCRGEQAVDDEGLCPLVDVEVAGDDGGRALVAFGDQVVQVLVGRRAKGFESEVINDEQWNARQRGELAVVGAGGARGVQALREGRAAGEDHVHALAHRAVAQGLCEVAFANAAGTDQQHRCLLVQVTPGGQVVHQRLVELGQSSEVELFERLGGSELRPAQPHVELLALAPGDLVADEHG